MTQNKLKSLLTYNKDTGIFNWLKSGKVAGTKDLGYIRIRIEGKAYRAHRLAWLYVYGCMPTKEIDHINRVKHDNRIINIRDVSKSENQSNRESFFVKGKGVQYNKRDNIWVSKISVNKKQIYIGSYSTKEEALIARRKAESFYSAI